MTAPDGLTLGADLRPGDRDAVIDGLVAYNVAHGFAPLWEDCDVVLRDAAGAVRGGALAETNAAWCFVRALWVDGVLRGRGHGRRLLAAVEDAARGRGCLGVYLDTYSFQARPFYEWAGYRVFGTLPDHPPGGAKYYLAKRFDEPVAVSPNQTAPAGAPAGAPAAGTRGVEIRAGCPDDAEAIAALAAGVQAVHAAALPHVFKPADDRTFPPDAVRALMAQPDRVLLVAEDRSGADEAARAGGARVRRRRGPAVARELDPVRGRAALRAPARGARRGPRTRGRDAALGGAGGRGPGPRPRHAGARRVGRERGRAAVLRPRRLRGRARGPRAERVGRCRGGLTTVPNNVPAVAPDRFVRLVGRVQPGKGDASRWLGRFNAAYAREVGAPIFPGSLNLALPHTFDWSAPVIRRRTVWFGREEYGGERDILLVPCRLVHLQPAGGGAPAEEAAWLWSTTTAARDRPDPWAVSLRATYGLADGALVAVELGDTWRAAPRTVP